MPKESATSEVSEAIRLQVKSAVRCVKQILRYGDHDRAEGVYWLQPTLARVFQESLSKLVELLGAAKDEDLREKHDLVAIAQGTAREMITWLDAGGDDRFVVGKSELYQFSDAVCDLLDIPEPQEMPSTATKATVPMVVDGSAGDKDAKGRVETPDHKAPSKAPQIDPADPMLFGTVIARARGAHLRATL